MKTTKSQFIFSLMAFVAVAFTVFAEPTAPNVELDQKTKLQIEIANLKKIIKDPIYSRIQDLDGVSVETLLQKEIDQKERELKILILTEKIQTCDRVLATCKYLQNMIDLATDKNGVQLIEEERARYQAELDAMSAK